MLKIQRLALVWSSSIIFLCTAPWLAIYALGYDIDVLNTDLRNALTVNTETAPDRAKISVRGNYGTGVEYSNTSFRVPAGQSVYLQLHRPDYLAESFRVRGENNQNTLARLQKINLLPAEPMPLNQLSQDWKRLNFISRDFLLYYDAGSGNQVKWKLQQYSFNGLLGESQSISGAVIPEPNLTDLLSLSTATNVDARPELSENMLDAGLSWERLDNDVFWQSKSKLLLFKNQSGAWQIWKSNTSLFGDSDVAWLGNRSIAIYAKNQSGSLYAYNLDNSELQFVTNNVDAISLNLNTLWIWSENRLYRVSKTELTNSNWSLSATENFTFRDFPEIKLKLNEPNLKLKVRSHYQGIAVQINDQVYYQPDSDSRSWSLIASDVLIWTSHWNSLAWLDTSFALRTVNMELNYQRLLGTLKISQSANTEILNLQYYPDWHRFMIYTRLNGTAQNAANSAAVDNSVQLNPSQASSSLTSVQVHSVWYNPDMINNAVKSFSWVQWLGGYHSCHTLVEDDFQMCVNNRQQLLAWRNNY